MRGQAAPVKKPAPKPAAKAAARRFHAIHSHGFVRVAACTPAVAVGDPGLNAAQTLALAREGHARACDLMRPALAGMNRLGGSHAQQDVLEQFFLEAAARAGQTADIRLVLERAAGRRAIPLERMAGWQSAARQYPL